MTARRDVQVVSADRRWRERLGRLLRDAGHVVSEEAGGRRVLESLPTSPPSLVAIDFRLGDMWGYELCHRLRELLGDSVALILLIPEDRAEPHDRIAALLVGADECFVKPFDDSEFLVHAERLMSRSPPSTDGDLESTLTPRELEVLRLLAQGLIPASIATELYISRRTVDTHVQHILRKLDVHSRTEAVALAYRVGIVTPIEPARGKGQG